MVDIAGFVMKAKAHPADLLANRDGARLLLEQTRATFPRLGHLRADVGYRGKALREWVAEQPGLSLGIVQRRSRWV